MNDQLEKSIDPCCNNGNLTKNDDIVISENSCTTSKTKENGELFVEDYEPTRPITTMKDTYRYPLKQDRRTQGGRRTSLLKKMYEEATAEVIRELTEPPPVEEYCTKYDRDYNIPGYLPENERHINKELFLRYPLYKSLALSFWNFKLQKNETDSHFPGFTGKSDLLNPFKRNAKFTKPLSEEMDKSSL